MKTHALKLTVLALGICFIFYNVVSAFASVKEKYTTFSYSKNYKALEGIYNISQYRLKNPKGIMVDEALYSYAAGAYLKGMSPVLINPEVPPFGKYLISISIFLFNNENIFNLIFCVASLPLLYLLSFQIYKSSIIAIFPPLVLSFDKVFLAQITSTPLLDILQLDFLFLAFIFFLIAAKKKKKYIRFFLFMSVYLGFFMSTKFFITGILAMIVLIASCIIHDRKKVGLLILNFVVSVAVLIASYSRLFFLGYSIRQVLGVQKWVFLFHTGHLDFPPFAIYDLLLFNKWHTWWADRAITYDPHWTILWPLSFVLSIVSVLILFRKKDFSSGIDLVIIWVFSYLALFSFGQITVRYFLLLVPFMYILSIYSIKALFKIKRLSGLFMSMLFLMLMLEFSNSAYASSSYVLPYPGVMPGNKMYKVSEALDFLKQYYSFGDFATFKYNLSESDKKLVEAKTLFEYNQYPLALQALKKSDYYFKNTYPNLKSAKRHYKDISEKAKMLGSASEKHQEILVSILSSVPDSFNWQDEKKLPVVLLLRDEILKSIKIRKMYE